MERLGQIAHRIGATCLVLMGCPRGMALVGVSLGLQGWTVLTVLRALWVMRVTLHVLSAAARRMVDVLETRRCVFAMMGLLAKTAVDAKTENLDLSARQHVQGRQTVITKDPARTRATVFAIMPVQGRPVMSVPSGDLETIVR